MIYRGQMDYFLILSGELFFGILRKVYKEKIFRYINKKEILK